MCSCALIFYRGHNRFCLFGPSCQSIITIEFFDWDIPSGYRCFHLACLSPRSDQVPDKIRPFSVSFRSSLVLLPRQTIDVPIQTLDMSLFQRGLGSRASVYATRPRPIPPGVRCPLRRVRHPRRHNASQPSKPEPPAEGKAVEDGSPVNANAPAKPSKSNAPSSSPTPSTSSQPANTAAAAAPTSANAVARSGGICEIIKASPVGRLGRWYARVQERKPYATQLYSSIIIYLCGDLSAQMLFPSEAPSLAKSDQEDSKASTQPNNEDGKEASRGVYDPWRTARHLIVGVGSSIPSYNW